jgi:hypothetical protein
MRAYKFAVLLLLRTTINLKELLNFFYYFFRVKIYFLLKNIFRGPGPPYNSLN